MRDLQLNQATDGPEEPVPRGGIARRFWLRGKRGFNDFRGIVERRRFRQVRSRFYESLWRDAAAEVGAEVTSLPGGLLQVRRGDLATFVDKSDLMLDSAILDRVLLNKGLTYSWLAAKGLRTPRSARFSLESLGVAERFLAENGGAVVVKPIDGTGCGHGVTTRITDEAGLRAAAEHAAAFHPGLLVEEQLGGASYRLLYLDGRFLDAVRRDPPVVTGDGQASIRQLVQDENDRRRACDPITALSPLVLDLESRNTLSAAGLTAASVPEAGDRVQVKLAVNENGAAENHVVRDEVHPDIVHAGERIVRDFGIGFAGLDLMSEDISLPPEDGSTVFAEINAGAGIHHHYLVAEPERRVNVAPRILNHIFATGRGVVRL